MKIEYLEEFLALADTRSFTDAAKRCHVSQSSFSKHIAAMEAELGADLLQAPRNPPRLTKAGWSLVHDARVLVNEWKGAVRRIDAIRRDEAQTVVLGYWMPAARPYLGAFHTWAARNKSTYEVKPVSLSPVELESALLEGRLDAALLVDADGNLDKHCNHVLLREERLLLAVPKGHRLAKRDRVRLADLEGEPFLRPSMQVWPTIGEHLLATFGGLAGYRSGRQLDDIETVLMGVEGGMGIAVAMEHNRRNFGGRIRFIHVEEEDETGFVLPLRLTWLKAAEESHNKAKAIDYLRKAFTAIAAKGIAEY